MTRRSMVVVGPVRVRVVLAGALVLATPAAPLSAATLRKPSVAFVVQCGLSHESNDDPIVQPGHEGMSHRHSFFGNRSTSASSTASTLASSPKTTCDNADDAAAYWAPSLAAGKWVSMRAYYDAGDVDPARIVAFPFGLSMVAGTDIGSVEWSCGKSVGAGGWTSVPTDCTGTRSITARVTFPQCWDAKHGLLAASRHMADPVNGRCPTSHPVAVPRLRLVLRSSLPVAPAKLSSGSSATMHADFINVWRSEPLATLVARCIRGERTTSAELRSCRSKTAEPAPL